jgi:hypothetical protein
LNEPGLRRRKLIAFILSGIVPGIGQLYNRELLKGGLFLVAGGVLTWLIERAVPADLQALVLNWLIERVVPTDLLTPRLLVPVFLLLAIWIWSVIDAWRSPRG